MTANYPINRYLRESGGSEDMTVNGSATPVEFDYTHPGAVLSVHRMLGLIQDTGNFDAEDYGALGAPLSNGMTFELDRADEDPVDLLGDRPIVTNAGWGALCYDVNFITVGQGDNYALVRWTFTQSGIEIVLAPGDRLVMTVNDDLTGLVHHRWMIQGHERGTPV